MALEDLERKQKAMADLGKKMAREKDAQEILRMADQMKQMAKELEKAANNLAEAAAPKGMPGDKGEVRVVLTPDQRQRITESTGVGMDTLVVDKNVVAFNARMGTMQKYLIERLALRQAGETAARIEKKKAVEKVIKKLEAIEEPSKELQEMIDQLKKDPDGLEKKGKEIAKRQKESMPDQG